MKNTYYTRMKADQRQRDVDNTYDGIELALNVVVVALNRTYGFGAKRLTVLEREVQRIFDEEFIARRDPEQAAYDLKRAVGQIRKEAI